MLVLDSVFNSQGSTKFSDWLWNATSYNIPRRTKTVITDICHCLLSTYSLQRHVDGQIYYINHIFTHCDFLDTGQVRNSEQV